jgi:GNAT superfamily N-acetyltransferase
MRANARFRQARESDALDLACLIDCASRGLALWWWSTLREPGQSSIEVGRHRIRTQTASPLHYGRFTVAEIDGAIAGALTGRLIPVPYEQGDSADLPDILTPVLGLQAVAAGSWYLNIIAVYPEYRGQGLGSALLSRAEEIAAWQTRRKSQLSCWRPMSTRSSSTCGTDLRNGRVAPTYLSQVPRMKATGPCSRKAHSSIAPRWRHASPHSPKGDNPFFLSNNGALALLVGLAIPGCAAS